MVIANDLEDIKDTAEEQAPALAILLVEDHDELRASLAEILEQAGHCVTAVDCAEAVSEIRNIAAIDVAVVDLNLPGESGLALTQRLREVYPRLGVVMVTVRSEIADKCRGYASGADIYLTKPVDSRELVMAIQALGTRLTLCRESSLTPVCVIERDTQRLQMPGAVPVDLTGREMAILVGLATAPARRLETWQLLELLGQEIDERAKQNLEVTVSRLRSKLKAHQLPTPSLQAERGRGYHLCLPVRIE